MSEAPSTISDLPIELLVSIFSSCDVPSIGRCSCVCKRFHGIIATTATLQLSIELYVAGQELAEDPRSPADLLRQIKSYNNAWNELSYVEGKTVPMLDGHLWELYGGVLALTDEKLSITFHRLPSPLKGIRHEEWILSELGVQIGDFGMDPSQDLLVLVEAPRWFGPNANNTHRIHLRTLSSGKPHRLASVPIIAHEQKCPDIGLSYNIQVSSNHVGIFIESDSIRQPNQLCIWDWKTGKLELTLTGEEIQSFVFYSERHVILAISATFTSPIANVGIAMFVVDFLHEPSEAHGIWDVKHGWLLALPTLDEEMEILHLSIRADPAPDWTPGVDNQAPFFTAKRRRTYALSFEMFSEDSDAQSFVLLVPRHTIQQCLDDTPSDSVLVVCDWESWGPAGSRYIGPDITSDITWVCYVNGSKYVNLRKSADQHVEFEVFDLNRKRPPSSTDAVSGMMTGHYETGETMTAAGNIFDEDVVTKHPYHIQTIRIPDLKWNQHLTAICSEDAILVVDSDRRVFRILSF